MNWFAKLFYHYRRTLKAIRIFFIISGPGIIVMLADNDAGGITTYAATGAKYGYSLIWFLLLLLPIAYYIQEMTVRLGAVTKRGLAEAIFDSFGSHWGWFALLDLMLVNWLTLVTEFIGMTTALSIFKIPPIVTVIVVCLFMGVMVVRGRYWTWEKVSLLFCALNLIYIPCAFLVKPSLESVLHQGLIPHFPGGSFNEFFFMLMANIGTTIAPWMIFFQQSSVVDKGLQEKDIIWGQMDTIIGAAFTVVVAIFIMIVTGTLLKGIEINSADQAVLLLMKNHKYIGVFLAIGLFNAGLLGAICISLASSWAFGEVFGWAHSLNHKVKEAPWFYFFYFLILVSSASVVLIPNAPLVTITLFVQVIAVTLLPAVLVFLMLLLNDEKIMGQYKNTLSQNIITGSIAVAIIILATLYAFSALFPNMFPTM
ncbi:MAG: Nramp family divalent metal transporter [Oligoflexia bacterium]|nr:Nramp family divalent metal transporter [Oligoflexia bacterium]